jgi:hypothetical protein
VPPVPSRSSTRAVTFRPGSMRCDVFAKLLAAGKICGISEHMKISPIKFAVLCACFSAVGCASQSVDEEDFVAANDAEIRASDLELRGSISSDSCVFTSGMRSKSFIAFTFEANAGQKFAIVADGYASPEMRILNASGKQVARGRKVFSGDGDTGGFANELTFSAPAKGTYTIAIRDANVSPGEALPAWVRAGVSLDDLASRAVPTRCRNIN